MLGQFGKGPRIFGGQCQFGNGNFSPQTLKSTPVRASQPRSSSPKFDSARTESTLEPQPVRHGEENLIDTALCLSSLQSLDKWLESSVALGDHHDWQEIPLVDSQVRCGLERRGKVVKRRASLKRLVRVGVFDLPTFRNRFSDLLT